MLTVQVKGEEPVSVLVKVGGESAVDEASAVANASDETPGAHETGGVMIGALLGCFACVAILEFALWLVHRHQPERMKALW